MKDIPLLNRYAQAQTHTHARALATLTFGDLRVRFVGFLCVTLRFHLAHPGNRSSRMTDPFLTLSCRDWFVCFRFLLQANFVFVSFYSFITDSERLPINRARTHTHVLRRLGSLFARIGEVRFEGPGVEAHSKARGA